MHVSKLTSTGLLVTAIAVFSACLQFHGTPGLAWDGSTWSTLVTSHLVHYNWKHWVLNTIGLSLICTIAPQWGAKGLGGRLALVGLGIDVALWWRGIPVYYGLSGALHGLWLWAMLETLPSWFGLAGVLLVIGKVTQEQVIGENAAYQAWLGFPVAIIAHAAGTASGLIGFLSVHSWQNRLALLEFLRVFHRKHFTTTVIKKQEVQP